MSKQNFPTLKSKKFYGKDARGQVIQGEEQYNEPQDRYHSFSLSSFGVNAKGSGKDADYEDRFFVSNEASRNRNHDERKHSVQNETKRYKYKTDKEAKETVAFFNSVSESDKYHAEVEKAKQYAHAQRTQAKANLISNFFSSLFNFGGRSVESRSNERISYYKYVGKPPEEKKKKSKYRNKLKKKVYKKIKKYI